MSEITAITERLRSISPDLEDVVAVLQVIQAATKLGGPVAATALAVIDAALRGLESSASGAITHEDLMMQLGKAHEDLQVDRATEDAELAARFPDGSSEA